MANNIVAGGDRRVEMPAGGTITSGNFVTVSSGSAAAASDGSAIVGISLNTYASGETAVIIVPPAKVRVTCASGYDPSIGDVVYAASATTVDGGSQNNISVGVIVDVNPSEAGTAIIELHSYTHGNYTTHA